MKLKSIVTLLLLTFVAVSVGYLIVNESRRSTETGIQVSVPVNDPTMQSGGDKNKGKTSAVTTAGSSIPAKNSPRKETLKSVKTNETSLQSVPDSKVVVYYFHGNTRCFTCRAIENFSRAAVGNGFPDELQNGRLEFLAVNIEEPANEHFVRDYQLVTRSLVLVRYSDGKQLKWKNLDRVWELVRDNDAFARYVQAETRQFLGGADAS